MGLVGGGSRRGGVRSFFCLVIFSPGSWAGREKRVIKLLDKKFFMVLIRNTSKSPIHGGYSYN